MLITIEERSRWFDEDSATLVNRLQEETGRYGSGDAPGRLLGIDASTAAMRDPHAEQFESRFTLDHTAHLMSLDEQSGKTCRENSQRPIRPEFSL